MGWKDLRASFDFVKIKDGETKEYIPVGETHEQERPDGNLSILCNMFNVKTGAVDVLRGGVILFGKIKYALKDGRLLGKAALSISREGSGLKDTAYAVVARELSAAEIKTVAAAELHDLTKIPLPDPKKGRGKK